MAASKKNPIKIKPSKKGTFRKATGTKDGEKIPQSEINAKKKSSDPAMRKKAVFADNAKRFKKGGKKGK